MKPGFFQFLLALFLIATAVFFMPLGVMDDCDRVATHGPSFLKPLPEADDPCAGEAGISKLLRWWHGAFDGRFGRNDGGAGYDRAPAEIQRPRFRSI